MRTVRSLRPARSVARGAAAVTVLVLAVWASPANGVELPIAAGNQPAPVDFGKLDDVFEPIPPGGGDDWYTVRDDFTAPGSGLASFARDGKSGEKLDGSYVLTVPEPDDFIAISDVGGRSYHVTVQATVGSSGSATDAGYGVVCLRDDSGNFFYGGVGDDGTYAIGQATDGEMTVLTGDGEWAGSSAIEASLESYDVRLTCDRDTSSGVDGPIVLTLTVDNEFVDSVSATNTGGWDAGIFLESFEDGDAAATFTSFLVATGGSASSAGDPDGQGHDYHTLVLNQPATIGSCSVSPPRYYHTRFPPAFVAGCGTNSYLPGTSTIFFAYDDTAESPSPRRAGARHVPRLPQARRPDSRRTQAGTRLRQTWAAAGPPRRPRRGRHDHHRRGDGVRPGGRRAHLRGLVQAGRPRRRGRRDLDRAARTAWTVREGVLGRRLPRYPDRRGLDRLRRFVVVAAVRQAHAALLTSTNAVPDIARWRALQPDLPEGPAHLLRPRHRCRVRTWERVLNAASCPPHSGQPAAPEGGMGTVRAMARPVLRVQMGSSALTVSLGSSVMTPSWVEALSLLASCRLLDLLLARDCLSRGASRGGADRDELSDRQTSAGHRVPLRRS